MPEMPPPGGRLLPVGHQEGRGRDEAVLCLHKSKLLPPLDRVVNVLGMERSSHRFLLTIGTWSHIVFDPYLYFREDD